MNPRQVHREQTGLRLSQSPSQQVRVSTVYNWGTGKPAVQLRQGTKTSDNNCSCKARGQRPQTSLLTDSFSQKEEITESMFPKKYLSSSRFCLTFSFKLSMCHTSMYHNKSCLLLQLLHFLLHCLKSITPAHIELRDKIMK